MDFQVGSYTVAMHTSGTNQWPNIAYHDVVVVAANVRHFLQWQEHSLDLLRQMLLDSLGDGNVKLSQAHLLIISDAQRVVPMATPHPVLRIISEFYNRTPEPPKIIALLTSPPDHWPSLDLSRLEGPFRAETFFFAATAVDPSLSPMELVLEYAAYVPAQSEPALSAKLRQADPDGLAFLRRHYCRAVTVFLQLGSFASTLYWHQVLNKDLNNADPTDASFTIIQKSLDLASSRDAPDLLDATTASPTCNASPKLAQLLQVLSLSTSYGALFRGVIYGKCKSTAMSHSDFMRDFSVKHRAVADTLAELLRLPDTKLENVRPIALSGRIRSDGLRQVCRSTIGRYFGSQSPYSLTRFSLRSRVGPTICWS